MSQRLRALAALPTALKTHYYDPHGSTLLFDGIFEYVDVHANKIYIHIKEINFKNYVCKIFLKLFTGIQKCL